VRIAADDADVAVGTDRARSGAMNVRPSRSSQVIAAALWAGIGAVSPSLRATVTRDDAARSTNAALTTMTLAQALAFAREHHPSLRSALARVAAAAAETRVPRAQWFPSVTVALQGVESTTNNTTATYVGVRGIDLPRIGGTPVVSSGDWGPSASTLAAVGAQQEVFDFGRIAAQAAVADSSYEVARHGSDAERLRIELIVKDAYYGVLAARAVLRAAEDASQRARVHRDMAAAEVKSGLHAPIDLTRAEADLARFDVGRIRASGSLRSAQAVLSAAVGSDAALVDVNGEPPALGEAPPLGEALQQAMRRDPALEAARAVATRADAVTRAVAAEARPDLFATASLSGRAGTAQPSSGSVSDRYGPLPLVPNWDVGLVLRVPLFDPLVGPRRSAAEARANVARADLSVLEHEEVAAIQEVYVSLEVEQATLVGLERAVDASHANYAQAEARFKAGLGTSLELADAENVRTDAEIQLAVGQFQLRRTRAALSRLIAEGP
jgi:outer membrane protein